MSGRTGGVKVESAKALPCNKAASNIAIVKASMTNNVCTIPLGKKASGKPLICLIHNMK